jgi:Dos2-interacting transcription regulator of RNA-Pol-II
MLPLLLVCTLSLQQLTAALDTALCGHPALMPHLMPMLLDKLASSVRSNKEAAMSTVTAAIAAYGVGPLARHLRPLAEVQRLNSLTLLITTAAASVSTA